MEDFSFSKEKFEQLRYNHIVTENNGGEVHAI